MLSRSEERTGKGRKEGRRERRGRREGQEFLGILGMRERSPLCSFVGKWLGGLVAK